jgi:hypothetical protein
MAAPRPLTSQDEGGTGEYPVGVTFDVAFDRFTVRLSILAADTLRFDIAHGPFARTETVAVTVTPIRPLVFLVSWVEASGATVVHVEDFDRLMVHSHATLRDGQFLRMHGPIQLVDGEAHQ